MTSGGVNIQVVEGVISLDKPQDTYTLEPLSAGETLYAFIEATSGDLKPALILESFNGKPLRGTNLSGSKRSTSTQIKLYPGWRAVRESPGMSEGPYLLLSS